jgi:putative tricarboxylic transport membrane protein
MLSGVYYGAQYGGAICSILLNLPCHPPHAVTCLDGFPLTKQGKGGTALGITIIAAFVGASFGITEMIFLAPFLVKMALEFGPAEVCSLMLVGLLAGSTLAKGSPLKGIAMTVLGLLIGIVGIRHRDRQPRFTFGITELFDGVEIIALALGMFGIAEFMNSINNTETVDMKYAKVGISDMRPSKADLKLAFWPMIRGTLIGSLCALIPGHRADHRLVRVLRHREEDLEDAGACSARHDRGRRLPRGLDAFLGAGRLHPDHEPRHSRRHRDGAVAGRADHPRHRAGPAAHQPARRHLLGPDRELLDRQHPAGHPQRADDRLVGEAAEHPYRYLYPSAMFFVCIGVYAANNDMFQVGETLVIGLVGYILLRLDFHPAPILLGFVLGPRFEENFRRSLLISRGDLMTFIERPISAFFV